MEEKCVDLSKRPQHDHTVTYTSVAVVAHVSGALLATLDLAIPMLVSIAILFVGVVYGGFIRR